VIKKIKEIKLNLMGRYGERPLWSHYCKW